MKQGRTLMYDVASFVITQGRATVDDIIPNFPEYTKHQLRRALQNASAKGIIQCLHNGQQRGVHGCGAATYGPRDAKRVAVAPARKESRRIATSVFDLVGVDFPSATKGALCCPLGVW